MNLQESLIVKEGFLQAVSSVTMSYTIYINRSCAPLLNFYNGLKTKCVKTCSNKISEALSTLASLPVSLFTLHQAGGKMCHTDTFYFLSEVRYLLTKFWICWNWAIFWEVELIWISKLNLKSRCWLEWSDVLQKQSRRLLRSENTEFFPVLENELLKLPRLPAVMMEELPLSQHVPHTSSVPPCKWNGEKSAICSPSDPQTSVPVCKVNVSTLVWPWPENRPNKNPFTEIL